MLSNPSSFPAAIAEASRAPLVFQTGHARRPKK